MMTGIVYYVAMSLDGYIATSDGAIDWLSAYETEGEDYGYSEFYNSIDALVMGRRTYEQILSFGDWPYPGKPIYVCSRTEVPVEIAGVTVISARPSEIVIRLRESSFRRIWLVGGGQLAASFWPGHLIDEYIISIMPIALGTGIPLFGATGTREKLTLVGSRIYSSGCVQLHYRRENR